MKNKLQRWATAIRRNVIIGLIALAPVAFTIGILAYVFRLLVANRFTEWTAARLLRLWPLDVSSTWRGWALERLAQFTAFLLILLGVALLGFFVRSLFGRRLYRLGERVIEGIPVVNRVYLFVRGVAEAVFAQRRTLFREVVIVEYPRPGLYSIAFITAHTPEAFRHEVTGEKESLLALFVPTTPNPTSGFLVYAPESRVRRLTMSTAEAMSLILSGGTIYPGGDLSASRPRLLDLLQEKEADMKSPRPVELPTPPPS